MNKFSFICVLLLSLIVNSAIYADTRFNLKTAPVSDLIGIINVELDIKASDHFTVGPSYSGFDYEHSETNYDADFFGVRANYYFKQALTGGWLFGVSALYGDFTISKVSNGIEFSTETSTRIYTALLSYQAMWENFNMTFGLGASYLSLPSTVIAAEGVDLLEIDTSFLSGVVPNAEFAVGWRF